MDASVPALFEDGDGEEPAADGGSVNALSHPVGAVAAVAADDPIPGSGSATSSTDAPAIPRTADLQPAAAGSAAPSTMGAYGPERRAPSHATDSPYDRKVISTLTLSSEVPSDSDGDMEWHPIRHSGYIRNFWKNVQRKSA